MARAHSIYILTGEMTGLVLGVFTVKHEMETARRHWRGGGTRCTAYRDGQLYTLGRSCDEQPDAQNRAGELVCDVRIPQASGGARTAGDEVQLPSAA